MAADPTSDLPALLTARTAPARVAVAVGLVLIVSGLTHAIVWIVSGDPVGGPLSFRKPASFGVSFGLTLATVGLIVDRTNLRHAYKWLLLGPYALASVYEVAWVAVQRWRGVPSHFAEGGADEVAWVWAGVSIAVVGLSIVAVAIASFTCLHEPEALAWAVRAGLIILVLGQGLGGLIISAADAYEAGAVRQAATTGAWKLPHGLAMHAIQVLPAIAVLGLRRVPGRALRAVRIATVGYALAVLASVGASPVAPVATPVWLHGPVGAAGAALVGAAFASVVVPTSGPYTPLD